MQKVICSAALALAGLLAVASEPVIIVQTQFYPWREQARGYLGRYLNQPLLVDPDLPEDPNREGIDPIKGWGSFPSQADFDLTVRLSREYGFDGVAFFGHRPPRFFAAAKACPVSDAVIVPIMTWGGTLEEFARKDLSVADRARQNPRNFKVGDRILLPSYWTDKDNTPETFKEKSNLVRAKYGDRFLFTVALTRLCGGRHDCDEKGRLPADKRKAMEDYVREWARVADGVQVVELNVTTKNEKSERVSFVEYLRTEYEIMRKVLSEPEFAGRKLLVGSAVNGHMNAYMKGYNCLENCTKTLRDTFGLALEQGCDVILLPEWDEYNENTCFMPTLYGSWALKRICRHFCAQAKKRPPEPITGDDTTVPNLIVSYRKCLSPGERLTIEVLNVPDGSRTGTVKVVVLLTDEQDRTIAKYGPSVLDETSMDEVRYEIDTAALAAKVRAPRVKLAYEKDGVRTLVADGLHPIDLAPANTWNHLAAKHPLRDLAKLAKAEVKLADGRFTASFAADEPIRYAMLCGNGCIQYVQGKPGSEVERFRDSGDGWAVFQISPVCVGRHKIGTKKGAGKSYSMSVRGVEEAEWLYVGKVTGGETLALDDINCHATPPIYLRVPKAKLPGLKLKVDYRKLFEGEVPLDAAYEKTSYSVGQSIKSMQVTVTRFPLQARYPSVANAKEVSFSVPVDADRDTMVYHVQVVTMSGKVWFSRPFVVERTNGPATMRLWNAMTERAESLTLPAARVPKLVYDFAPGRGNVIAPASGERHWFGMLGGPYSSATLWNRGARTEGAVDKKCAVFLDTRDDSCPKRVREPDGSWALEFDGVDDFANIPCETLPTFGGCTIEMDVCPAEDRKHRGPLWANRFGLFDLGVERDGTVSVSFGSFGGDGAPRPKKGGRLKSGEWNHLKLVNDAQRIVVEVNGVRAIVLPIRMPAVNTMGVMLGGYPVYGLGFFKGKIRNLTVSHRRD